MEPGIFIARVHLSIVVCSLNSYFCTAMQEKIDNQLVKTLYQRQKLYNTYLLLIANNLRQNNVICHCTIRVLYLNFFIRILLPGESSTGIPISHFFNTQQIKFNCKIFCISLLKFHLIS
jgi:hypothetical protein